MCIHGKHKQARRTFTYMNFLAKPAAVLFATDIAARGLDFPEVDWVVQVQFTVKPTGKLAIAEPALS